MDGRAGLVVRGSGHPIAVYGDTILTLSAGPAAGSAGIVVEGLPDVRSADLARLADAAEADAPRPATPGVTASLAGRHLSIVNLTDADVDTDIALAADGAVHCYEGTQRITGDGQRADGGASARRRAWCWRPGRRSRRSAAAGRRSGWSSTVDDAVTARLSGIDGQVEVAFANGERRRVTVSRARTTTARVSGTAYPLDDLALTRQTFPTSPLPATMTSPAAAVDGDATTAWEVTGSGRMVVDLGSSTALGRAVVDWGTAPGTGSVEVSDDGLTFRRVGRVGPRRGAGLPSGSTRRRGTSRWR